MDDGSNGGQMRGHQDSIGIKFQRNGLIAHG